MKRSPPSRQYYQKGTKFHKKLLLVHIVEFSAAVVKFDAILSQNQCLQCVTPPLMRAKIP